MNPYESPQDEPLEAEVIEWPVTRWYHIAAGPFAISISLCMFWLVSLGGWETIYRWAYGY